MTYVSFDLELFHTPDAEPTAFCRVVVDAHHEVYRVPSRAVRALLVRRFYTAHRKAVRSQALAEALGVQAKPGTVLRLVGEREAWVQVARQDGRRGWVERGAVATF